MRPPPWLVPTAAFSALAALWMSAVIAGIAFLVARAG